MYMERAADKGVPLCLDKTLEKKFKTLVGENIHVGINTYDMQH